MISSWIFDEFIICATIFLIPPVSALSFPLCVPHPPANCVNITHFHLIYQGVLQRIFGMLSVKIGLFLTMLRCFCLLSRHWLEPLLQQNPHQHMQPLHPALRSGSILSLQGIFQYNHPVCFRMVFHIFIKPVSLSHTHPNLPILFLHIKNKRMLLSPLRIFLVLLIPFFPFLNETIVD